MIPSADELQDELDKLDAMIAEKQLPDAAAGYVEPVERKEKIPTNAK